MDFLKSDVGPKTEISVVVKGNAYGHGIENIVALAEENGIRHFSTFSADEAIRVNEASKSNSEVMVMGMLENEDMEEIIRKGISFYVFEFDRLKEAINVAKKIQIKAKIHVEVETGFHRTGFEWEEKEALLEILKENAEQLSLKGLCTHYAGAESISNYVRVRKQIKQYKKFKQWFDAQNIFFEKYHTACSAATLLYPETKMDLVRIGIASYGFWPTQETYMYRFQSLAENNKINNLNEDGSLSPNTTYSGNKNSNFSTWNLDLSYSWWFAPGSQMSILYRNNAGTFDRKIDKDFSSNFSNLFQDNLNHVLSVSVRYFIDYNQAKNWIRKG